MGGESRGTLRARLALLYACLFLASGAVLLIFADLPLLTFGSAVRAAGHGGQPGTADHVRSTSNLPEVLLYSGIALAGLAVVSVALGWVVADRALRPLRAITAAARAISASNLSASNLDERLRLSESYEEFRELGDTLDELFARLEAAFESQRHFVANASHELRTPLAAERTVIQVALADPDASAESLRSACQQLLALGKQQERLIDALLTLASSQRGLHKWEPFDLAEIVGRVVLARGEEAARRAVHVDSRLAPAVVTGDPHLTESLIANLVDNAIRHNVAGGEVTIATAATSLFISNTGAVIPPDEVDRLFEPFQQLAGERTRHDGGHGLGLAIVASIARAHDAVVTARARPEGGLEITVRWLVAGADWPAVGYRAVGDDEQFAGQVDHRADVVGHHADEVANP
jgi:signal transduction histidine kinase